jgi:mediator of RNA polymerase II transcription subunit 7
MEQEQFRQLPAAPFPAPPPFWKHFTKGNVEKLAALDADSEESNKKLPLELLYLRPPPPPPASAETYITFAVSQALNPAPAPPPPEILLFDPKSPGLNPAALLSRLTKSVLLNFLELTTILGNDPMQYEDKMSDINRIMLNIHFVINMYRPHQAREGVKEMLQARLEDGRKEIAQCDAMKEKVEAFLMSVERQQYEGLPAAVTANGTRGQKSSVGEDEENRKLWEMIHSIEDD